MILIDNIKFSYGKHEVFDNLSLQFGEGTIYGLLGLNGAGKSTLLYLMCGLLFPQGGKIEFNGYDATKRNPNALAGMFLVPEEFELPKVTFEKYVKLHDSYLSIVEALNHASFVVGKNVKIKWVDSDSVNDRTAEEIFSDCRGIILPGGFGHRGVEGMVSACRYARTHKVPYFGICLGMQIAVIEYARSVLGYADANPREFDELCEHPVIDLMKDQEGVIKGGTMRLGSYPCRVKSGSQLKKAYGLECP